MQALSPLPIALQTARLLTAGNVFMTIAWQGDLKPLAAAPWRLAALLNRDIARFECLLQVPAKRIGHRQFSSRQRKVMPEMIARAVSVPFALLYLKAPPGMDCLRAALCLVGAASFMFRSG